MQEHERNSIYNSNSQGCFFFSLHVLAIEASVSYYAAGSRVGLVWSFGRGFLLCKRSVSGWKGADFKNKSFCTAAEVENVLRGWPSRESTPLYMTRITTGSMWNKVQRLESVLLLLLLFLPILMAVSCLSPVRIQILMSAFIRVSMVSGTLSWSLSSIAVAPRSCRFYARESKGWGSISREHNRRKPLKPHVSYKNLSWVLCHSNSHVFLLISCLCLLQRKTTMGFGGLGSITAPPHDCASLDMISTPAHSQIQLALFSQETRRFFGIG